MAASSWIFAASVVGFVVLLLNCTMLSEGHETINAYGGCVDNKHCVCQIPGESPEYTSLKTKLEDLEREQQRLDTHQLYTQIVNITSWIEHIQTDLTTQNAVQETITRLSSIAETARSLSETLNRLKLNSSLEEQAAKMETWLADLKQEVNRLGSKNEDIQEDLEECTNKPGSLFEFPGDDLPITSSLDQDWCSHYELDSLDEPITHKWFANTPSGSWFKDPLPPTDDNKTQIWYGTSMYSSASSGTPRLLESYGYYRSRTPIPLYVYKSSGDFSQDNYHKFPNSRSSNGQPQVKIMGIGFVLYNGEIFTQVSNQRVDRWQLNKTLVLSNSNIPAVPSNYNGRQDATFIDLKVDEYGLWAIYATEQNSRKLVVSRVDPERLTLHKTFRTNKLKAHVCVTFMVCGRLYAIDICNSGRAPEVPYLQYTYDTIQAKDDFQRLHITSKYGKLVQLTYNPRERLLFGWDNGHLVTYNIKWRPK